MKDIARDLGVSVVTVSKVLRNHEDISEATRKRVLDRVKELDYTPNLAARGLVTGKTYLVGLIVPDLLHPFFAQVAKSLSRALLKKGYCLTISTSEEDAELESHEINRLLGRRLDALVIASSSTNPSVFERIQKQGLPLVLIDRKLTGLDANYVGTDDEAIGLLATEHLIEVGCERIAHLRGPDNSPGAGRLKGYQLALTKHNLDSLAGYVSMPRLVDVQSRGERRRIDAAATGPEASARWDILLQRSHGNWRNSCHTRRRLKSAGGHRSHRIGEPPL
jgi:LacI family transcriptional regulator